MWLRIQRNRGDSTTILVSVTPAASPHIPPFPSHIPSSPWECQRRCPCDPTGPPMPKTAKTASLHPSPPPRTPHPAAATKAPPPRTWG